MSNNRTTLQWVKASERKPNNGWEGVAKWDRYAETAHFHGRFYQGPADTDGYDYQVQPFEWLEETPSSTPAQDWEAAFNSRLWELLKMYVPDGEQILAYK